MTISRLFVVRPVATSLLMIAMVLVGLVSVSFLPVSSLPDVDYPTIQVQTFYPGASPQVMSTTVTAPLEVQLGQIPGLQQMTSSSSATASIICSPVVFTLPRGPMPLRAVLSAPTSAVKPVSFEGCGLKA